MSGEPQDRHDGIVISRGWLALVGTLAAVVMTLGSWGVSQNTARSTMALQLEQLERRIDAGESRNEQRRTGLDQTWRGYDERLSALSDRLARIEARMDAAAGIPGQRSRTGFECWRDGLRVDPNLLREVSR
jgi:hypothetical protein